MFIRSDNFKELLTVDVKMEKEMKHLLNIDSPGTLLIRIPTTNFHFLFDRQ